MVRWRRRGTAIVDTPRGMLVVSQGRNIFLLPGGGAKHHESREAAAKSELREETGLHATSSTFLFEFRGGIHTDGWGTAHKVFLMTISGVPRPRREIKRIAFYDGANVRVSWSTAQIIEKYRRMTA